MTKRLFAPISLLLVLFAGPVWADSYFGGGASSSPSAGSSFTGGTDKYCLFNDANTFGQDAGCQYDKATDILTLVGGLTVSGGVIRAPVGSAAAPSIGFSASGFYQSTNASGIGFVGNGAIVGLMGSGGYTIASGKWIAFSDNAVPDVGNADTLWFRNAAADIQQGVDAASPIAQTYSACDGSGTDIAGCSLTREAGAGTGTGIGGDLVSRTAPASTTGASVNSSGDRERILAKYTTLTEGVATAFARVAVPSGTVAGGEVVVTVEANDATDYQARTLRVGYSAVNKAGTITAGIDTPDEVVAVSVGTLTCTITAVDATGNNLDLKANCTSSLTQTVLRANAYVGKNFGTGAISAQ